MTKLQSIIDEINSKKTTGKYLIWKEGCNYTGKIKVSLRWQTVGQSSHIVIKSACHANSLIKSANEILKEATK